MPKITGSGGSSGTCLNDKCVGIGSPSLRGLCMRCHKEAKGLVERGETTWEELAGLGLCRATEDDSSLASALKRAKLESGGGR